MCKSCVNLEAHIKTANIIQSQPFGFCQSKRENSGYTLVGHFDIVVWSLRVLASLLVSKINSPVALAS